MLQKLDKKLSTPEKDEGASKSESLNSVDNIS
jgi:hypothetical protein